MDVHFVAEKVDISFPFPLPKLGVPKHLVSQENPILMPLTPLDTNCDTLKLFCMRTAHLL